MTNIAPLLERNRVFAGTDARTLASVIPRYQAFVVTCLDPRLEPAAVLGIELGDAIVLRNAGGRITEATIADIALISYLGEVIGAGADGTPLEVAIIHHTQCGTGFLADQVLRHRFAERTGYDETALADEAVIDPTLTVRVDVERLLASPHANARITVSGHVYDIDTGIVSMIIPPTRPHPRLLGRSA